MESYIARPLQELERLSSRFTEGSNSYKICSTKHAIGDFEESEHTRWFEHDFEVELDKTNGIKLTIKNGVEKQLQKLVKTES